MTAEGDENEHSRDTYPVAPQNAADKEVGELTPENDQADKPQGDDEIVDAEFEAKVELNPEQPADDDISDGAPSLSISNAGDNPNFVGRDHIDNSIHYHNSPYERAPSVTFEEIKSPFLKVDDALRETKLSAVSKRLNQNRIAVVQSALSQTAESIVFQLKGAVRCRGPIYEVRFPAQSFDDQMHRPALSIGSLIDQMEKVELHSITILDVSSLPFDDGKNVMESIIRHIGEGNLRPISRALAEREQYLVLWIGLERDTYACRIIQGAGGVKVEELQEAHLLATSAIRRSKVTTELTTQLIEQLSLTGGRSPWGENPHQRIEEVFRQLQNGTLETKIKEYMTVVKDPQRAEAEYTKELEDLFADVYGGNKQRPPPGDSSFCREVDRAMARYLLPLLTTFTEITISDLNKLMKLLLEGEVETIRYRAEGASGSTFKQSKGARSEETESTEQAQAQAPFEVQRIDMTDAYFDRIDELLDRIDCRAQPDGQLRFSPANKRLYARSVVHQKLPVFRESVVIDKTITRGALLQVHGHLANQLADEYVKHLVAQPSDIRRATLFGWMNKLASVAERDYSGSDVTVARAALSERIGKLLDRLVEIPGSRSLVDEALNVLVSDEHGLGERFDVVLDFVRHLHGSPNFSTLFWLKRLLSEGDLKTKTKCLRVIASMLDSGSAWSKSPYSPVLSEIAEWLPKETQTVDGVNSQAAALLAPRIAFHLAASRTRPLVKGEAEYLPPLFDARQPDLRFRETEIAAEIFGHPATGNWLMSEVQSIDNLVSARWPGSTGAKRVSLLDLEPRLSQIGKAGEGSGDVARRLCNVVLFTEAVSLFVPDVNDNSEARCRVAQEVIGVFGQAMSKVDLKASFRQAYRLHERIAREELPSHPQRRLSARLVGNVLYRIHKDRTSTDMAS